MKVYCAQNISLKIKIHELPLKTSVPLSVCDLRLGSVLFSFLMCALSFRLRRRPFPCLPSSSRQHVLALLFPLCRRMAEKCVCLLPFFQSLCSVTFFPSSPFFLVSSPRNEREPISSIHLSAHQSVRQSAGSK